MHSPNSERAGRDAAAERAKMARFDPGHRLELPGGYWLHKDDDNRWQLGRCEMFCAMHVAGNTSVGPGGSMDLEILEFAAALSHAAAEGVAKGRQEMRKEVVEALWGRLSREEYGHAKAAVALDIEAVMVLPLRALPARAPGEMEKHDG